MYLYVNYSNSKSHRKIIKSSKFQNKYIYERIITERILKVKRKKQLIFLR